MRPSEVRWSDPIFQPQRRLKVVCIGAGASGLLLAYKIQRHFDNFDLVVYEKNADVSGTWFENKYQGCACDVPSHNYTWSFEPKADWSGTYATSGEIFDYFKQFGVRPGLEQYIKLQHTVIDARWSEEEAMWHVTALNTVTQKTVGSTCHVLINAAGILKAWKWPLIPGLQDYKGKLLHSAAWETETNLQDQVVGLIGNGSSGIQILPAVLPSVKSLTTFIREPTWVAPPLGQEPKKYTDAEIQQFKTDPQFHLEMRQEIEKSLSDWSVGCRRITPGIGYLEALNSEKVRVVHGGITKVTSRSPITEDGKEHPVDVLICATGFDTSFKPRFSLVGRSGKALADVWKDEARAYLGIAVNDYPNYFMTLGPNCPIGNGPVLIAIEAEVEYIIKFLSKFQKEDIRSFDVRQESVDDFNDYKDAYMENTIWSEECKSWYKNENARGKIAALWPGSTLHYLETLAEPRYEDWKFTYDRAINRFTYLGNGFSTSEKRTGDLSYDIRDKDDSTIDPCLKGRPAGAPSIEESARTANNLLIKGDTRGQKIAAVGETVAKL
ncbi:flavin-binding monooxygenase, partial [Aureobasidium melanogenum]